MPFEVWSTLEEENKGEPHLEAIVETKEEADELSHDLMYEHCCADTSWVVEKSKQKRYFNRKLEEEYL
ncbi:hypothetical protein [Bacillus sp. TH13]|uniref:hypothetical protein n=1 Tax=Bacillus sp. TH13 TaxID=2796379 RepID=UPI0019130E31|nr:hypothetical protein [Bacillus sp. TH13]MBK5492605.1 hypothetical protein [Bacillus sp. TH13]